MKLNVILLNLVVLVVLLTAPVFGVNTFFDNFDNQPSQMWGNERGDWYGHDGVYDAQYPSDSPLTASLLPTNLTDFAVDVDINNISEGGIWLRSSYENGSISGVLLSAIITDGTVVHLCWRVVFNDHSIPVVGVRTGLVNEGDNVHVRIVVSGDTYSCYLNGSLTPCTTITNFYFQSGQTGLCDYSDQTFDNFSVTTGVEVSRSLATKISAAWDPIMVKASANFRFTFVGKVNITPVNENSFWLDDGSNQPIKVITPAYSGFHEGDWVRATGVVTYEEGEPVLQANDLTNIHDHSAFKSISGYVRTSDGRGLGGVYVGIDGPPPIIPMPNKTSTSSSEGCYTDSDGYYSIQVPNGWTGYINVYYYSDQYTITPEYREYENVIADQVDQNFEAIANPIISGHIKTADGTPIAGVGLLAYSWDSHYENYYDMTDSDGYYSFVVPIGWSGEVQIAPTGTDFDYGFDLYSREYTDVTTDQIDQDFEAIYMPLISGYIKTADGTPVYGAEIHMDGNQLLYTEYTNLDGYYSFRVSPGYSGVMTVEHPFYYVSPQNREFTDVATDQANQNFEAIPNPTISGYVRTTDGTPLVNVGVHNYEGNWVYTDFEGYYKLTVPRGWSGSVSVGWNDSYTFSPDSIEYTNVETDQSDQDFEAIYLPVISGYVKTADGTPVYFAEIHMDGNQPLYTNITNADGYYSFRVSPGCSGVMTVEHPLYYFSPQSREFTDVTTDQADQNFEAIPNPTISGYVRTANGTPVVGALIHANWEWFASTDSNGYYSLIVPRGWSGSVSVDWNDLYTFTPNRIEYTNVDKDIQGQNFEAIARVAISGYVRTADGNPVSGVYLSVDYMGRFLTDSNGYYDFAVPSNWSGNVSVDWNEFYTFSPESRHYVNITTNQSDQNFVALVKPTISGYVRTANGTPVEGIQINLSNFGGYTFTNSDGYYEFKLVSGWSGKISVQFNNVYAFNMDEREYINIVSDQPNQNFEAIPNPVISGHVRTADGYPVANAQLYAAGIGEVFTDEDGYYSISVPVGWDCVVNISANGLFTYSPESREYTNVIGDIPGQDFEAIYKLIISGRVMIGGSIPVENAYVYLNNGESVYTNSDGYYSIRVPVGWSGSVTAEHYLYDLAPGSYEYTNLITDQDDQDFEAIAKPVISGYIKTSDGTPIMYVGVGITNSTQYNSYTDANGYYSIVVPTGWSGATIVFPDDLYTFAPQTRDYVNVTANQVEQNFEAIEKPVISGYIRTADGLPLDYIFLYASDGGSFYTDWDGYYSIHVPAGWSGTISVEPSYYYTFTPQSREYTNVVTDQPDQNYEATANPIISGRITTSDGVPVYFARIMMEGLDFYTATDWDGYYALYVPVGWSGKVAASHYMYDFSPENKEYTNVISDQYNQDFEALTRPTISGYVRTSDGDPISGVYLIVSDISAIDTVDFSTNSNGYYCLPVPKGWSGTFSLLSHDLYTFAPQSREYTNVLNDQVDQNFEAVAKPTVSGYVTTADGTPVEGIQVYLNNWENWAITDSNGYYSLIVPPGWNGTVTAWNYFYEFTPGTYSYTNVTANQTNQNFEAIAKIIIEGYIRAIDGNPVSNACLAVSGIGDIFTDFNGFYLFCVSVGWSGTVSISSHDLYTFNPQSNEYTNVTIDQRNQNYEAIPKLITSECISTWI